MQQTNINNKQSEYVQVVNLKPRDTISYEHNNFVSVHIDMSKILDAVFNEQRFVRVQNDTIRILDALFKKPQFEDPKSVGLKNFDNTQTPLNAESLATDLFIASPPPQNNNRVILFNNNYVPATPRTIDINKNF